MSILAIREVSRFVVGAALIRERAIQNAGNDKITVDDVAEIALAGTPEARGVLTSIGALADQEAAWFRNTPPHVMASERVAHSRIAEIETVSATHRAVVATVEHLADALAGDRAADSALRDALAGAVKAIDGAPGSAPERRHLLGSMRSGIELLAGEHAGAAIQMLHDADRAYMQQHAAEILARYQGSLDKSDDFTM